MELLNELIKAFSFPELVSQGGGKVDGLVIAVHLLMLCLFVGWIIYYFVALWKFRSSRNPKADYKGVKSKTITNSVEGGIIVAELILVVVATYFWNFYVNAADDYDKVAAMANGSKRDLHVVRVTAEQFGWNARYPGPNGRLGKQDKKLVGSDNPFGLTYGVDGEDDIAVLKDDIVVPMIYNYVVENPGKTEFKIGELLTETEFNDAKIKFGADSFEAIKDGSIRSVTIDLTSKDVIHCFKVLPLRVCQDAIPGLNIPIHFKPSKIGRYTLTCAQLCGDGHALMRGIVKVVSEQEWNQWQKTESEKNGSKKQQASVSSSDEKA
jgi:cytochrome c oxidase subunit 2